MKQLNKLLSAFSTKTLMLLSFFALLPIMASAQCPDNNHPHMIDLGLPSGTKWACCNVGASKPEDHGGYFAWGETEEKDVYDWSMYIHWDENAGACNDIGSDISGTDYDVAHVKWSGSWVMPSIEQYRELRSNTTAEWTTENGVNGFRFTSSNGRAIFLPDAGFRWESGLYDKGCYWCSSSNWSEGLVYADMMTFEDGQMWDGANLRYRGIPVRPVVAGSSTPTGNIDFADDAVKALCVANWDTNGDGELSYAEAAAVIDLGNIFSDNQEIKKFNELQYFTGLTSIGERAFDWCTGLTSVIIPNSVTNIGFGAFRDCSSLTSVTIPDNVSSIDTYAFMSCERLTSITIPNNVTSIGSEAFSGCSGLTSIKVESGNTKYDSRNNCNAIIETNTNILITGCMNTIIPNSVTTIGDFAFYKCSGLISVNIPNSVTSIGNYAFDGCTGLTSVTIPNSVTSIGRSAFQYCTGLTSVTIPNSVTSIGRSVFYWCTGLTEVISLIEEPWGIDESTFMCYDETGESYYPASTLYVPAGTKEKYEATAGWNKFQNIVEMGASSGIAIDATNFPDENFRNWVLAQDYGQDGVLTEDEIDGVTEIDIDSQNIADLKGLEYFTALTQLWCDYNELTSLDVSKNTALTRLCCAGNQLTSLDLSQNTALITLYCYENQINETEMGKLVESLPANNGELLVKRLDISNEQNVITTEQVAAAKAKGWYVLALDGNVGEWGEWVEYDGDASAGIAIDATNFPDENFRNWVLAQDYGQDGVLTEEEIAGVKEIDVGYKSITDLKGIEYFTALTTLYCVGNQLTTLDVSHNTVLMNLYCDGNKLTSLDVSRNIALTDLSCQKNKLTSLDVTMNTALTKLNCYGNQLSSLDVSQNTALTELVCYGNQLTSLDVSKNTALKELNCPRNQLTSLDLSKNTALECLICYQNQLTSLDVSKNTALRKLNCYYNQLTSLDVSMNTALTELSCYGNQLTSLDVSQNTALTELSCGNYLMTSLDVSKNTALTVLSCGGSQLTSLDVSKNTALRKLNCDNNRLTSLDVSKNTALTELYCYSNQINETEMENLVESLPENPGEFYVKNMNYAGEQNVITTAQVAAAKAKGWTVYALNNDYNWVEYDGDEPQDISPVNEGETIDIGNEIDENTDIDGNVVGDVYYSISSGDGNYDAAEGCLVVTKPTDDSAIDGQDIFGEDFKDNYTGIVFKLAPGKGSIKVEAETQGNMVLKVKIGNSEPIEMELDGKLKVKFPYNVSEPTYVYIYGGMGAAGAKAMGANRAKSAADLLKIYGFEIVSDPSGIDAIENGQPANADAPVYNLNGQRVNTLGKGIYIKNGRKVLMK